VEVPPIASALRERFRCERGVETVPPRHVPHGLAVVDLTIGRLEGIGVPDRQLLLTVAKLRIVLLYLDPLRRERRDQVVHHAGRARHPDRRETKALIERPERPIGLLGRQAELALERRADAEALSRTGGDLALEERPRTSVPRRSLQRPHVAGHR